MIAAKSLPLSLALLAMAPAVALASSDVQIDFVDAGQNPLAGLDVFVYDADGTSLVNALNARSTVTTHASGDSVTILLPEFGSVHEVQLTDPIGTAVTLQISQQKGASTVVSQKTYADSSSPTILASGGPPTNDDCMNAIPLMDGDTPFSTLGATTDGPIGTNQNDIWYIYTATCTGNVTISTCDQADYDTDLLILTELSTCATQTALAINDDGAGCTGFTSILTAPVVAGSSYLVSVGGFNATSMGTGILSVSCEVPPAPPANDECSSALPVALGVPVTVDNTFATNNPSDPDYSCIFGGPGPGVGSIWFSFIAEGTAAQLDTSASLGSTDTVVAAYDGPCDALIEIGCNDDDADPGLFSEVTLTGLVVGQEYFVQVSSFSAASAGDITLSITNGPSIASSNGSGINTSTLTASNLAIIGQNFDVAISDGSAGSLLGIAGGAFTSLLPPFGELLIGPSLIAGSPLVGATGAYSLPVPDNAALIGATVYLQGLSIADVSLTNGLEVVIGAF